MVRFTVRMLVSAKLGVTFTFLIQSDGTIWPNTDRVFDPLFQSNRIVYRTD